MRPERLELSGFAAFREPTVVELADVDLFALSGATGAGKSSLIDAICFALYGVVPRYGDQRLVAPVISQGKVEARVRLDFSVAGRRYGAVRVVRATKAGATTKEARLVDDADEVLAGTADELTAEVTRLLGMGFEHFTTCVVLPQGRFAEFLHAKPAKRQDLLVELLSLGVYGRMMQAARQRAARHGAERDGLDAQLADLADATDEALAAAGVHRQALAALTGVLDDAAPRLAELDARLASAAGEAEAARRALALLAEVVVPADVGQVAATVAEAQAGLARAEAAEEAARQALAARLAERQPLGERATVERALADLDERAELARRADAAVEARAAAAAEDARAGADLDLAAARVATARRALEAARRADLAAALVPSLAVGDPCPVCRQVVHDLPAVDQPALDRAEADLAGAEATAEAAQAEARRAADALAGAAARHEALAQQLAALDQRLAGADDRTALAARLARIDEAELAVEDARGDDEARRSATARARRHLGQVAAAEAAARRALDATRDRLAALEPPPLGRTDLAADWQALAAWAEAQRPAQEAVAGDAAAVAEVVAGERAQVLDALVAACRTAGMAVEPGVTAGERPAQSLRDAVVRAQAAADEEHRRVEAARQRAAELAGRRAEAAAAADVAATLATHLDAKHFERWVLGQALRRLVVAATGVLLELSSGAYSLDLDDRLEFAVVDHTNADARRSVRTLSGGETFLASLALALALAEQVAQLAPGGAAKTEAIFLDEGFGTLDADTLDVVATAIEDLGAAGRMVGVISHVPELAERLPVRFHVTKTPATALVERIER